MLKGKALGSIEQMIFIEALKVNTSITELKMKSEEEIKTETFKRSK